MEKEEVNLEPAIETPALVEARRKFAPIYAHPDDIERAALEYVAHCSDGTSSLARETRALPVRGDEVFKADETGH